MSAGFDFAPIRSSSAVEVISAVSPPFNPTAMSRPEGRPVVRSPRTTAAASRAGGTRLDRCNRRVQRRRPADEPVRNRADSDHDERDDSRGLWALAVSGVRE